MFSLAAHQVAMFEIQTLNTAIAVATLQVAMSGDSSETLAI